MAGLLTLVVIRLKPLYRCLVGVGMLVAYQLLLDHFLLDLTIRSPHGGLFGSVGWAAMMILGTCLADLYHNQGWGKKTFFWVSLAMLAVGVALAFLSPVSKHRVSSSYVLITLGISALLSFVFDVLSERYHWKIRLLQVWGKNPLVLYFLHYLLIGIFFIPGIPAIYTAAPLWLVLMEMLLMIGVISAVAFWLDRRNLVVAL